MSVPNPKELRAAPSRPATAKTPVRNERFQRRLPIGAELLDDGGVHFRVWAPQAQSVVVEFGNPEGQQREKPSSVPLERESDGYHSGVVQEARAGTLYKFRLGQKSFPDPASRYQPEGPHG